MGTTLYSWQETFTQGRYDRRDNTLGSFAAVKLDRYPGSTADASSGMIINFVATLVGRDLTMCRRVCSLSLLCDLDDGHSLADLARQDGFDAIML
ncbi:MAG: hypothetical protein LQ339_004491 [Xanthoria mediterranea]|nr:MAG: hypothetical protein LQ339_004491 [Xanthoria mediterranea]